jgi:glutaminyl-peptide cyclotransferase
LQPKKKFIWGMIVLAILLIIGLGAYFLSQQQTVSGNVTFNGERAFQDVEYQMALGPRIVGSSSHSQVIAWMEKDLAAAGWKTEPQNLQWQGQPVQNVIAKRGNGSKWIVLGAHYDSRLWADQDPDPAKRKQPVPGANDGASGVAVLLELARTLPKDLDKTIWLVFFDAEDNGDIPGYDWLLGSKAFVATLAGHPDAAVVVDMIGDKNLDIYMERNSNPGLTTQIWQQAATLGYQAEIIQSYKYSMLDDHTPFLQAGIPAVDMIDFDYPAWHTTQDTTDKVSAKSLQIVGDTLRAWVISFK